MQTTAHFRVDPKLAHVLGENYTSSEKALKELIDNAWDAEATEVHVTVPSIVRKINLPARALELKRPTGIMLVLQRKPKSFTKNVDELVWEAAAITHGQNQTKTTVDSE